MGLVDSKTTVIHRTNLPEGSIQIGFITANAIVAVWGNRSVTSLARQCAAICLQANPMVDSVEVGIAKLRFDWTHCGAHVDLPESLVAVFVALPVRIVPHSVTGICMRLADSSLLGGTDAGNFRIAFLSNHVRREDGADCERSALIVLLVRNPNNSTTLNRGSLRTIAVDSNEARPCFGIGFIECIPFSRDESIIVFLVRVESGRVSIVANAVVIAEDAFSAKGSLEHCRIISTVGHCIVHPAIFLLDEAITHTGMGKNNVKEVDAFTNELHIVVFAFEVNQSLIKHVERQFCDVGDLSGIDFHENVVFVDFTIRAIQLGITRPPERVCVDVRRRAFRLEGIAASVGEVIVIHKGNDFVLTEVDIARAAELFPAVADREANIVLKVRKLCGSHFAEHRGVNTNPVRAERGSGKAVGVFFKPHVDQFLLRISAGIRVAEGVGNTLPAWRIDERSAEFYDLDFGSTRFRESPAGADFAPIGVGNFCLILDKGITKLLLALLERKIELCAFGSHMYEQFVGLAFAISTYFFCGEAASPRSSYQFVTLRWSNPTIIV